MRASRLAAPGLPLSMASSSKSRQKKQKKEELESETNLSPESQTETAVSAPQNQNLTTPGSSGDTAPPAETISDPSPQFGGYSGELEQP